MSLNLSKLQSYRTVIDTTLNSGTEFLVDVAEKSRLRREGNLSAVAYIQSNCDNPSGREAFVKELMKHISVDSYGGCLQNKEFPEGIVFNPDVSLLTQNPNEHMSQLYTGYNFPLIEGFVKCAAHRKQT